MPNTIITGSGSYLPTKIIGKDYFMDAEFYTEDGEKINKPNEEIIQKFVEITEIENRRYVEDDEMNSDIGHRAAKIAIEDAKIDPETLDYIIFASNFGDVGKSGYADFMPNLAAKIKNKLGIRNRKCITYDMVFGCPGWVEAMVLADILIKSKQARKILVVGAETLSRITDPHDRNRMIFADGAGAVIVEATENPDVGILNHNTLCDNTVELEYLANSPSANKNADQKQIYITMKGRKIYEYALKNVPDAIKDTIDESGLSLKDIKKILIHQANAKMDYAMIDRLHRLYGEKEYDHSIAPMTIQELGNSSVATVPTMFDLIRKGNLDDHHFNPGDHILFASVGAGMNINCMIYKFPN